MASLLRTKMARAWAVVLPVCLVVYLLTPSFDGVPGPVEMIGVVIWMLMALLCGGTVGMLVAIPVGQLLGKVFYWIDQGE